MGVCFWSWGGAAATAARHAGPLALCVLAPAKLRLEGLYKLSIQVWLFMPILELLELEALRELEVLYKSATMGPIFAGRGNGQRGVAV